MQKTGFVRNNLAVLHASLTAAAALAILVLSVIPLLSPDYGGLTNTGLAAHILAYGVLCVLTCMWLHVSGITSMPAMSAALVTSLCGFLIECVQYFVLYRNFEIIDILINCCAALAAILPGHLIIRYIPLYKKSPVSV